MGDQPSLPGPSAEGKQYAGATTRILLMLVLGTVAGLLIYFSPRLFFSTYNNPVSQHRQLKTGGTSAIVVVAENYWKSRYLHDKDVEIVCDSAGTTLGVERMLDKAYTVAFTHAPVSASLREKAKEDGLNLVHIPLLLCGVVPAYHIAELKDKAPLKFTGEVLADIFLGKITQWNDPALKATNPGVDLPAKKITVVHREDSSGTTELFTEYLAAVSPAWAEKVGPSAAKVKWPVGIAASRNQGVAIKVYETDGAIGYVDRLYVAFQDIALDYGAVQNKDKSFTRAEPANLTAAVREIHTKIPEDLTFSLTDQPGKDSYPIAGVIYAVCSDKQSESNRRQIVDFLRWATHEGQADVTKTGFAPLPSELVQRVDRRLDAIHAAP